MNKKLNEDTQDLNQQPITKMQLNIIEKALDKLFRDVGVNIDFTKHFFDRLNDERNVKNITVQELTKIYKEVHDKYGEKLGHVDKEDELNALITSITTLINIPIALRYNKKTDMIDCTAKTIMRVKKFFSHDSKEELQVESTLLSFEEYLLESSK